jgi:hypothetical protein
VGFPFKPRQRHLEIEAELRSALPQLAFEIKFPISETATKPDLVGFSLEVGDRRTAMIFPDDPAYIQAAANHFRAWLETTLQS